MCCAGSDKPDLGWRNLNALWTAIFPAFVYWLAPQRVITAYIGGYASLNEQYCSSQLIRALLSRLISLMLPSSWWHQHVCLCYRELRCYRAGYSSLIVSILHSWPWQHLSRAIWMGQCSSLPCNSIVRQYRCVWVLVMRGVMRIRDGGRGESMGGIDGDDGVGQSGIRCP